MVTTQRKPHLDLLARFLVLELHTGHQLLDLLRRFLHLRTRRQDMSTLLLHSADVGLIGAWPEGGALTL